MMTVGVVVVTFCGNMKEWYAAAFSRRHYTRTTISVALRYLALFVSLLWQHNCAVTAGEGSSIVPKQHPNPSRSITVKNDIVSRRHASGTTTSPGGTRKNMNHRVGGVNGLGGNQSSGSPAPNPYVQEGIETYRLENFPKNKIALHFACPESNTFSTNCACHLKCHDPTCRQAFDLCAKYRGSKGCKYVLLRGYQNKIATLKREPTEMELSQFNLSAYPTHMAEIDGNYSRQDGVGDLMTPSKKKEKTSWQELHALRGQGNGGPTLEQLLKTVGGLKGQATLRALLDVRPHKLCGSNDTSMSESATGNVAATGSSRSSNDAKADVGFYFKPAKEFLEQSFALVALNYRAPMTLLNSLRTWNASGLLDMTNERLMVLNDPYPSEIAMAMEYGFEIMQPKDVPGGQMVKPNVFTIGAAFYYTLMKVKSEYVIFLENDFKVDLALSQKELVAELFGAAGMLNRGIAVVRMLSRKGKGCGTFKDCNHSGIHLSASSPHDRLRNWYTFYCRDKQKTNEVSAEVADCLPDDAPVAFRCFTSWDSNWTLNGVIVKKSSMLSHKYLTSGFGMMSIADIGLKCAYKQDAFESSMINEVKWMYWKVPLCISYNGVFIHEEIETSA